MGGISRPAIRLICFDIDFIPPRFGILWMLKIIVDHYPREIFTPQGSPISMAVPLTKQHYTPSFRGGFYWFPITHPLTLPWLNRNNLPAPGRSQNVPTVLSSVKTAAAASAGSRTYLNSSFGNSWPRM
jgi:hypothetical protein